ncbi:MAG: hypothetical protein JSU68_11115 [Phycisphaerales bacterium]|nr:MAG: hypothetical protein JSU68_11115 [Phycisphaerales bacterium]
MKRALVVLAVLLMANTGCTTVLKRGYKEAKGASGKVREIKAPTQADLRTYRSVRAGTVTNEIGIVCNPGMLSGLKTYLPAEFAEMKDLFPGGDPALTVDVAIQYAQKGGGVKAAIGSDQYLISRVKIHGRDGSTVGDLILIGHSEAMRTSDEDLAKAAAHELATYLRDIHTPSED